MFKTDKQILNPIILQPAFVLNLGLSSLFVNSFLPPPLSGLSKHGTMNEHCPFCHAQLLNLEILLIRSMYITSLKTLHTLKYNNTPIHFDSGLISGLFQRHKTYWVFLLPA